MEEQEEDLVTSGAQIPYTNVTMKQTLSMCHLPRVRESESSWSRRGSTGVPKKRRRMEGEKTNSQTKQHQEQSQIETSTRIIASIPLPRTTSSVLGETPERINTYSCFRLKTSQRWFKSTCLAGGLVHLVKIREM